MRKLFITVTAAGVILLAGCSAEGADQPSGIATTTQAATTTPATTTAADLPDSELVSSCVDSINDIESNISEMYWVGSPEVDRKEGVDNILVSGQASIETAGAGYNMYNVSCMVGVRGGEADTIFSKAEPYFS